LSALFCEKDVFLHPKKEEVSMPTSNVAAPASKPEVQAIPEGFRALTPHLIVEGALAAIDFYKKAFDAREDHRLLGPDGKLMHGQVRVGDSVVMLAEANPVHKGPKQLGGVSAILHLYVPDADAAFKQAVDAGATVKMPVSNTFWGDRYGIVEDPFGHQWSIATHVEDVAPADMPKRMEEAMAEYAKHSQKGA
jgi:PhnB protein